jgi:hypothetical protein
VCCVGLEKPSTAFAAASGPGPVTRLLRSRDVAEACLAHYAGGVEGRYNRGISTTCVVGCSTSGPPMLPRLNPATSFHSVAAREGAAIKFKYDDGTTAAERPLASTGGLPAIA